MSYRFIDVKQYKRGASWPDGSPRMCIRCGAQRQRRRVATYTAFLKYAGAPTKLPVGYCDEHAPDEVKGNEVKG